MLISLLIVLLIGSKLLILFYNTFTAHAFIMFFFILGLLLPVKDMILVILSTYGVLLLFYNNFLLLNISSISEIDSIQYLILLTISVNIPKNVNNSIYNTNTLKNYLHSSSVHYMNNQALLQLNANLVQNNQLNNQLPVVLANSFALDNIKNEGHSTNLENFPWLFDKTGYPINFHEKLNVFDGVKLVSNFLEKKYEVHPEMISEQKISEILFLFTEKKEVTVLDLYNHVSNLYKINKDFYVKILTNLKDDSDTSVLKDILVLNDSKFKPLGDWGDIAVNDLINNVWELKWSTIIQAAKLSVQVVPLCINFIGYGIILRSYIKHVYKKEYDKNLSYKVLQAQKATRNKNLAIFALIGAPLTIGLIKLTYAPLSDIFSISVDLPNTNQFIEENPQNNGIFMIISKVKKYIPDWLKYFFYLLFISLFLLKILGFLDVLFNLYYLKIFSYFSCILALFYQLANLYFLNKFANQGFNISNIYPQILIDWLKELEVLSSSKESIIEFKTHCYINISLYLVVIICTRLILG